MIIPRKLLKEICQRYNVNMTSLWLHNLSGPVVLWRRMTSGVLIHWGYVRIFTVRGLMLSWQTWSIIYLVGEMITVLCGPTISWTLVKLTVPYKCKKIAREFPWNRR